MNGRMARRIRKEIYGEGLNPHQEAWIDPKDNQVKIRGRQYHILYREKDIPIVEEAAKLPVDAPADVIKNMKDKLISVSRTLRATGLRRQYQDEKARYNRRIHSSCNS